MLRYGPDQDHVADLRLPALQASGLAPGAGHGPAAAAAPLVLLLHGGFWRAAYDRVHAGPMAAALAAAGFAVCTPEYRRIGQPGGGWPGTFDDVAAAVDILPGLVVTAGEGRVAAGRVLLAGHSAGGHLALWAAARHRLPAAAPWHSATSRCDGVVALAAVSDLVSGYRQGLSDGAVAELLGGGPDDHPTRYAMADPARLLPAGQTVRLVHGRDDDVVPCQMSLDYAARACATGDEVVCRALAGAGHFDVIDPLSDVWPQVLDEFSSL